MWSMILLMSRLWEVIPCLRADDRNSSATNSRQSAARHYQAIGADRTQRSSTTFVKGLRNPGDLELDGSLRGPIQWRQASVGDVVGSPHR